MNSHWCNNCDVVQLVFPTWFSKRKKNPTVPFRAFDLRISETWDVPTVSSMETESGCPNVA